MLLGRLGLLVSSLKFLQVFMARRGLRTHARLWQVQSLAQSQRMLQEAIDHAHCGTD